MKFLPHDPISLDEAAEVCLRGLVKASTLRAAAERGELAIERLGRRIVTTPADLEAWRIACREKEKARTCTFVPLDTGTESSTKLRGGSSETDDGSLAQEAALAALKTLKKRSVNTSQKSMNRRVASVISIKSASRT